MKTNDATVWPTPPCALSHAHLRHTRSPDVAKRNPAWQSTQRVPHVQSCDQAQFDGSASTIDCALTAIMVRIPLAAMMFQIRSPGKAAGRTRGFHGVEAEPRVRLANPGYDA